MRVCRGVRPPVRPRACGWQQLPGQAGAAQRLVEARAAALAAAGAVAASNGRIEVLRDALARARSRYGGGITVTVLAPIDATGQDPAELLVRCQRVNDALTAAETALAEQIAASTAAALLRTGGGDVTLVHAAEALAALPERPAAAGGPGASTEQTLARVLARLLPDALPEDHRLVTEAAARVATAEAPGEVDARLDDVRIRVQQANQRTVAAREARTEAAFLVHELTRCPGQEAAAVRADLTEVVAGRRALTGQLRERAAVHVAAVDSADDRRYVADTVLDALADLGYRVDEGFETVTADGGTLRLVRSDWSEHAVHLRIQPETGQIDAALVRTALDADGHGEELDVERGGAWCAAFDAARERIASSGVQIEVHKLTPPGARPVPVVDAKRPDARATRRGAAQQQQTGRRGER